MARNSHLSILDGDGQVIRQLEAQAKRALEMADRMKELPPQTAEEIEAERFAYESNAYASDNALYAAARSTAVHFLVVPLDGDTPLVETSEATREPRKLFAWWLEYPDANPGVLLGRVGGIFALRVEDSKAWELLKEMAAVPMRNPDTDRTYTEYRDLNGAAVRLVAPSQPFSVRSRSGWGREWIRAIRSLSTNPAIGTLKRSSLFGPIRAFRAGKTPSTIALAPLRKESACSEMAKSCPGLAPSSKMAFR
jgi:plasmid stabilization system protein ParE